MTRPGHRWRRERGSLTLLALCLSAVIGIALASYLTLCNRTLALSIRQTEVTQTRQLAEIGLEEIMWSLNTYADPNSSVAATAWDNADWSGSTPRTCALTGYNLGRGNTGQIALSISDPASSTPTVISTSTVTLSDGTMLTRTLTATLKPAPLFFNAVGVSNGRARFRNSGTVDSYDSSLGAYGGSNVGFAAVVAGTNVTITNATINGYAATMGNAVSYSSSGKIKGPSTPSSTNIDTARISTSAFIPTYTVNRPGGSYTGTLSGSTETIGTPGGPTEIWHRPSDLSLGAGETLTIDGPVIIIVGDDLSISSTGRILITVNGRLQIYVDDDVLISGSGGIQNATLKPQNCALFSLGTARTFTYSATANFYGVIYSADNDVLTISSSPTIYGAIMAKYNVDFGTGTTPVIHYDVALRNLPKGWFAGVTTPFIVNNLTEQ